MEREMEIKIEPKRPWMYFHWQNLNDKPDRQHGSGWRNGRCWWNFRSSGKRPDPDIRLEWFFWTHFFGVSIGIDDEDLTFHVGFLLAAFWLSFSTNFSWIRRLAPWKILGPTYPDTLVIDEGEIHLKIHDGRVWIKIWGPGDWDRKDPWWRRGVAISINPFELVHVRHEVLCSYEGDYFWEKFVGLWERGDPAPDHREIISYPYRYVLDSGVVQDRTAAVFVDRRAWRPRCFQWTALFEKGRTCIDVTFNDEVGERTGSWKGGTIGCGQQIRSGESSEQCLRRMERERKFR